ncbi:MAG: transglycosylase SLT domain-containing protein [Deltaproteobacteria bacterium]|nr:transglycosylase SLT domain-containing protein [Deltaproteobacteria bacterium]
MSAVGLLGLLLHGQLLLGLGLLLSWSATRLGVGPRAAHRIDRALLVLALALPPLLELSPGLGEALPSLGLSEAGLWRPPAQVWPGDDPSDVVLMVGAPGARAGLPLPGPVGWAGLAAVCAVGLRALWRLRAGLRALLALSAASRPWRRVGGVPVRLAPLPGGALSLFGPRGHEIIVDEAIIDDPVRRDLCLRHELQHVRQGDPLAAWLHAAADLLAGWSPLPRLWARHSEALDELAVDAALRAHPRVSPRAYGALLLQVADAVPPGAGLGPALSHPALLRRRLHMLARPTPPRPLRAALAGLTLPLLLAAGLGARALAEDRRAPEAAVEQALSAHERVDLEQVRHPVVERELRALLGPGQAYVAGGLERRPSWAPLVDGALADAGLPRAFRAVPLIESGYTNWGAPGAVKVGSAAPGAVPGRGLWMFIAPTARAYGLRVEDNVDERLDPARETAAAVALLRDMHARYGDWRLALAAYNMGHQAVDAAIAAGGTRDPWALTERGLLNPYAAQVAAAALILEAEGA